MTPDQIAKSSEHSQQVALFAWASMAQHRGFDTANDPTSYETNPGIGRARPLAPVPELRWLFAIANGGKRDIVTASRLKAEGVKPGIPDIFLPYPIRSYHGLYIEMKAGNGKLSKEQSEFGFYCSQQGYKFYVCYTWREAANVIQNYLT